MTSADKKKSRIREIVSFNLSIILSLGLLYYAFTGVDLTNLWEIISSASIFWVIVFAFLTVFAHYLRALRWKFILSSVKPEVKVKNLFSSVMIGYGVNNIIPRLGEIARAVLIGQTEKISRSSALGTIVIERVIDIIFFGLAVILSAFIFSGDLYTEIPWLQATIIFGAILIFIGIIFLVFTIKFKEKFYSVLTKIISKLSEKLAAKLGSIFEKLILGFSSLKGSRNYFLTLLFSVLIMLTYAATSYVGFITLNMQSVKEINFGTAWIVMSISAIGVMIPTPGGIGSYHTITKSILITLFGFAPELSLAFATLTHGISYFTHLIIAAGFFLAYRKQITKENLFKIEEN